MPNEEFEGIDIPLVDIPDGLEDTIFHRAFTETPTLSDDIVPDLYSEEKVADDSFDDVALDIDAAGDNHLALDDGDLHVGAGESGKHLGEDFDFSGGVGTTGGVDGVVGDCGADTFDTDESTDSIDGEDDLFGGL